MGGRESSEMSVGRKRGEVSQSLVGRADWRGDEGQQDEKTYLVALVVARL